MEGSCLKFLIVPISCFFIVVCNSTYNITMIRLSSYLVYLPVLFIPAAIIGITTSIITNDLGQTPFFSPFFCCHYRFGLIFFISRNGFIARNQNCTSLAFFPKKWKWLKRTRESASKKEVYRYFVTPALIN